MTAAHVGGHGQGFPRSLNRFLGPVDENVTANYTLSKYQRIQVIESESVLSQGASHWNAGLQPLLHAHVVQEDEALERQSEGSARSTLAPAGTRELRSRAIRRQETRSGQGALARRHTDGPLRAALLRRR